MIPAILLPALLAVVLALALVGARRLPPRGRWRGAPVAAALFLLLAAAGVAVPGGGESRDVLVVDVSYSTGEAAPDLAAVGARAGLAPASTQVVLFGERAVAIEAAGDAWPAVLEADAVRAGRGGSDAAAGLRLAAGLVGRGGRVVLATDGRVDAAAAGAAAADLRAAGAGLSVTAIGRRLGGDGRVDALRVPSRVRAGDSFSALVAVAGPPGVSLDLELLVDGRSSARRAVVMPDSGVANVRFAAGPVPSGRHEVEARLTPPPGDPAPENDRLVSGLVAAGARSALVVGADAAAPGFEAAGFEVGTAAPENLPDLAPWDVVVLSDVAAPSLADGGGALAAYVRGGGGLVLLGGPHAFGPGGYADRPIESASPLLADPPGEGLFVCVLLDRSATMGETGALSGALAATRRLLRALPAKADFLFVPFTDVILGEPQVISLSAADGPARAQAAVDAVGEAHGRTSLAGPLRRALAAARERTGRRLVLLLTDGRADRDDPARLAELADGVRASGARLVVLAAGEHADRELLDRLAGPGAEAVPIGSPEEIGGAFLEGLLATEGEDRVREGEFPVVRAGGPDVPVPADLSPVRGYVRTWAAPGAKVWLRTADGDPVAAARRSGLGTAVAVATDPLGDWAWAWGLRGVPALLAGYAARPASLSGPRVEAVRLGDRLVLRVRVGGEAASVPAVVGLPGPANRELDLPAVGPGRYEAVLPASRPGPGWIAARAGGSVADGGFGVPWPPEYGETGPDPAGLAALVAAVGDGRPGKEPVRDASVLVALLALLLFLADRAALILKMRGRIGR